jgi:hypothetical protein
MIAAQFTNTLMFNACFNPKILNFLMLSNGPCLGPFSVGELNVI